MRYRRLGKTGLMVSEIGLGGEWLERHNTEEVRAVIDCCEEQGINILDCWMPEPNVRSNIGKAIAGKRKKWIIQGHFGSTWQNGQYVRTRDMDKVKPAFEDLLTRLGTDYIDLGMLHNVDAVEDYQNLMDGEFLAYAKEQKRQGTVRHIGISTHNPTIAKMAIARTTFRIPTPYLTHRAFFAGHQFYVDRRVIIPRSPIAELIENEFRPYLTRRPERVLDMCTGSGCIAIAIALQFDGECEVDAVDISDDALEIANMNIQNYDLEQVVTPIKSDLFDNLLPDDKYDLIVANPPYVNAEDLEAMPDEYQREPALALGSGADGLDCVRRILAQARSFLTDEGVLIVEVGNTEENLIETYPNVPFHFIELKRGGSGVFLLTADQLELCAPYFEEQLKQ